MMKFLSLKELHRLPPLPQDQTLAQARYLNRHHHCRAAASCTGSKFQAPALGRRFCGATRSLRSRRRIDASSLRSASRICCCVFSAVVMCRCAASRALTGSRAMIPS
jgi:hypothetical protein